MRGGREGSRRRYGGGGGDGNKAETIVLFLSKFIYIYQSFCVCFYQESNIKSGLPVFIKGLNKFA